MKLKEAEETAQMVTRPVKMTVEAGRKILGRFIEVREIPRENDDMGPSRVAVLKFEDANFKLDDDQIGGDERVQVYMSGQLDYLVAQACGKIKPGDEPYILITYKGITPNVETEFGKKDVHRFTLEIVPEKKK